MSVATIERSTTRPAPDAAAPRVPSARSSAPVRQRPRRPGPGTGPGTRPTRVVPAPSLAPARPLRPQACRTVAGAAAAAAPAPSRSWRLTERGLAVVMVTAVLIVTAAVAVVGLTALRVTSESYHATGSHLSSLADTR